MFTEKNVKDAAVFFARAVQCLSDRDIPARYEKSAVPGHPELMAFSCSMIFTGCGMDNAAGAVASLDRSLAFLKGWHEVAERVDAKAPIPQSFEIDAERSAELMRKRAVMNASGQARPAGEAFIEAVERAMEGSEAVTWVVCLVTSDGHFLDLMLYSIVLSKNIPEDDLKDIKAAKDKGRAAGIANMVPWKALSDPDDGVDGKVVVPLSKVSCKSAGEVMGGIRKVIGKSFPGADIDRAMAMARLAPAEIARAKGEARKGDGKAADDASLHDAAVFAQSAGLRSFESACKKRGLPIENIMSVYDPGPEGGPKIPFAGSMSVFAPANGKVVVPVKLKLSDETEGAILSMFPDSPYIRELVESRRKLARREGGAPAIVIRFVTEVSPDAEEAEDAQG